MSEKLRGRLRLAYELLLPLFERPVVISAKRAGEVWVSASTWRGSC